MYYIKFGDAFDLKDCSPCLYILNISNAVVQYALFMCIYYDVYTCALDIVN